MKRFRFNLERVLGAREAVKKVRQAQLAAAMSKLDVEERRLESIVGMIERRREEFREKAGGRVSPASLSWAAWYSEYLEGQRKSQEIEVEKSQDEVEICRHRLVQARKDTRVLERLKEKRKAEHTAAFLKEEQDRLDEVGGMRHRLRDLPGAPA